MTEATRKSGTETSENGMLMRLEPETMPSEGGTVGGGITSRHGESVITLPSGTGMETIAEPVRSLNSRYPS